MNEGLGFAGEQGRGRHQVGTGSGGVTTSVMIVTRLLRARPGAECLTAAIPVRTVKGVQVDGQAVGLPEALATVPADIRLVPSVGPHVAGQLNGLGEHSITILAGVHFPWKQHEFPY